MLRRLIQGLRRAPIGLPALVVAVGAPLLVLAPVVAYLISARAIETLVQRCNDAAALITAAMVERELDHWLATLTSHAGFPTFSAGVATGDVTEVRRRLEILATAHSRLDRVFVTDPEGLLWADFPVAPESLGRRFDERDWYRGVARAEEPYVSEVYRRHAEPRIQVVAVAAPVRSPSSGELAGFLVAQIRLDDLSALLGRVEVGADGVVFLRDHTGALAAHPTLDLPRRSHREYAEIELAPAPAPLAVGRGRYTDPFSREIVLASSARVRVGSHEWTVISQQPVAAALAPSRGLALELGTAGLLMATLMGGLLWALTRENTERRRAERRVVAMNEELERRVAERTAALEDRDEQLLQSQKMEAVGLLAGGIAHDFNNLLTVILGCADLLLPALPADAPHRREVEALAEAAERAAGLTKQLLAFSRRQVMQPRVLDVNESVERMRGILERVLGGGIELVWRLGRGLHPVKFDPDQIAQVVLNLAVNARDAMPQGGRLSIATRNVVLDEEYVAEHVDARLGPHVVLTVTDTGTGMDAETRKRIFEPFFTTKPRGRSTGLGLSTVYGIVRQGGGNIWVYSEPGKGTSFKIYLPRTEEVPEEVADEAPAASAEAGSGTILVVDDEAAIGRLLVRALGSAGYDVLAAKDAESAVALFRSRAGGVDLLLTDVILPGRSGPELAAELAAEQEGLRVLFMSGYTDDTVAHHGVALEATAFVEKPLRLETLLARIRYELARS